MNAMESKREIRVLIGASGAISVLNLHLWIAYLKKNLVQDIRVILTDTAQEFVNPQIISSFTGHPTYTSELDDPAFPAAHVSLPEWADLFLILPASANMIGKAANGIADDLLSSAILAAVCPVVFVPSMNLQMWNKPAMQRNIQRLQEDGYHVLAGPVQEGYRVSTGRQEESIGIDISQIGIKLMRLLRAQEPVVRG
jgi:phosphopantothenoylcysteine synthetase/decarboxylase